MIDELREERIVNKVGGRFKLSTLIQKRMVALNTGAKPLIDTHGINDKMQIVLTEILQDKIFLDAQLNVEGKGDQLAVTDETACRGKRSLKVVDNTGLQWAFNPHFFYSPQQSRGVATLSFDIRMEAGASTLARCTWTARTVRPSSSGAR